MNDTVQRVDMFARCSPKLRELAEIEGYDTVFAMLEHYVIDTMSPGICMTPGCDYTVEVEQDCRRGWCERCRRNSVASAFILAGVI